MAHYSEIVPEKNKERTETLKKKLNQRRYQYDLQIPHLSVKETLGFAAYCLAALFSDNYIRAVL